MGVSANQPMRIGRAAYWGIYLACVAIMVACGLYFMSSFSGWNGQLDREAMKQLLGSAVGFVFLTAACDIIWGFAAMWRCRDIGWPPFLPWVLLACQLVVLFLQRMVVAQGSETSIFVYMILSGLFNLAVGIYSIVIGCIQSQYQIVDGPAVADYGGVGYDSKVLNGMNKRARGYTTSAST